MFDPTCGDETKTGEKTDPETVDLSDLLGSRICHDLISPLGAIANGIELLTLSGQADSPEVGLIAESVEAANAKIRFFRIAFGHADRHATLGGGEIREILAALARSGRNRYTWIPDGPIPRPEVKLAFLLVLCAETALTRGGTVSVDKTEGTWRIDVQTPAPRFSPNLWSILAGQDSPRETTPGEAHFPLAARWAIALGRTISVRPKDDGLTISF